LERGGKSCEKQLTESVVDYLKKLVK
jgi:hypothetical protein